MAAFHDQTDGFVRWFFNSSPTTTAIEPQEPVPMHLALLRHGFVAGVAVAAIVVLMIFYSVVASSVDRAAEHRASPLTIATVSAHR
ncbi:MAG: hypothetical protein ABI460_04300 [Caldimonas sp.]